MTPELTALTLAGLLQVGQIALMSVTANLELPSGKTAMNNHFEGLILFTLAVLVVTLGDQSTPLTATCAWIYLAARLAYVPAYAFGWVPWRSLIWLTGLAATTTMLIAALI